jgi:hypothetical protein
MRNTFFMAAILIFANQPIYAQFYTITRNTPIEAKSEADITQLSENEANELLIIADSTENRADKVPDMRYANIRKRHVRRRSPELTIPNLVKEIKRNGILYPDIVLAQAILETGWFRSVVCREKNNLFGLTNPRTGQYYEFDHWTESVTAYKTKVQYKYRGGDYLTWLRDLPYAESATYIRALTRLLRQLQPH